MEQQNGADQAKIRKSAQELKFIRLLFCDFAGIRRCRVIPFRRLGTIAESGVGLTKATPALPAWGDVSAEDSGFGPVGEVRLVPAMDAVIRPLPWRPTHAIAICELHNIPGDPWECCPRSALKRILAAAQQDHGLTFRVGYESEFVLLRQPAPGSAVLPPAFDRSVYCQTSAFDAAAPVMDDIVEALEVWGMPVEQLHAEAAHGQFEVVTTHDEPLQAADGVIFAREAIASVAAKHGLVASFLPKLDAMQAGSGQHLHISLWKDKKNLVEGFSVGEGSVAEAFLAGILSHLPALQAFTVPSPISYERLRPGCWSGAFQVWGVNNKEAPVRLCTLADGSSRDFEFKALDATANPYLALAALLTAGLLGVKEKAVLPPALQVDPGTLSAEERNARGIRPLASNLAEALTAFNADTVFGGALKEVFGGALIRAFLAGRRSEWKWDQELRKQSASNAEHIARVAAELYHRY
ncbi:g11187 [Coccomyxa elongata]